MKKLTMLALFVCICVGLVLAHQPKARSESSNAEDIFQKMTQDWEDATQARDVGRVSQIEADDWRSVGSDGKGWTKEEDLNGLRSGKDKHVQAKFGPMDVKMLGDDVAVVQGTLTDKSAGSADNDRAKWVYPYMDVWVKRGGKWMVIRSQYFVIK